MIKLTIISDEEPARTRSFKKNSIIIGGPYSSADLKLPDPSLQNRHVQILSQKMDGQTAYFIINLANDPFVSLNGAPFGRQPLSHKDSIHIGNTEVLFEIETSPRVMDDEPEYLTFQSTDVASTGSGRKLSQNSILKNDYINEYEEEEAAGPHRREKRAGPYVFPTSPFAKSWRILLKISACVFSIMVILAGLTYLWVSDQSGEEEVKAARGIADVAMALTYAQFKHIHPQNQNWSYPDFIKNNLTAILASAYPSLADFDAHGQFSNCPYMLRIYPSSDLSQFLVIAQPTPSLLHWLIPKASIVIDSRVMEMRKIKDLKVLNRLLVNTHSMDGNNAGEISNLVKQGELIPLSGLIGKKEHLGFNPPKALGMIRPGAENLIYNAPRYYSLGENLLNTALDLVENRFGSREVSMLQQELDSLIKMPNLILYSSEGIQKAVQAQKALSMLAPKSKFLIAYLQLNPKRHVTNAHLLIDDHPSEIALTEKPSIGLAQEADAIDYEESGDLASEPNDDLKASAGEARAEIDDPLFLQLSSLANARQSTLKPISDELIDLLKKHSQTAQPDFQTRFDKLEQKYLEANKEQQVRMSKKFDSIIKENEHFPAIKLLEFIKSADLKVPFQDYLADLGQQSKRQLSNEEIDQQMELITSSKTWQELEQSTAQINRLLQFEHIPDATRLPALQSTTRSLITQKLNQFILSSDGSLPPSAFTPDYLHNLTNILKAAWIDDQDTIDFYIGEFELREP